MKNYQKLLNILLVISALTFASCNEVVDIDPGDPGSALVAVDGWLESDTISTRAKVALTYTQRYTNKNKPLPVTGKNLKIVDLSTNQEYALTEDPVGSGIYLANNIGPAYPATIDRNFRLIIEADGETYTATSTVKRVPRIDSLVPTFQEKDFFIDTAGYFIEYYSRDFAGKGDFYWFKTFKNGSQFQTLNYINDEASDGLPFIPPVRINMNEVRYQPEDTVTIQNYSITEDAFFFLRELEEQVNNGGLFSRPIANVRTNVLNTNPQGKKAVGYFGCSGTYTRGIRIKP